MDISTIIKLLVSLKDLSPTQLFNIFITLIIIYLCYAIKNADKHKLNSIKKYLSKDRNTNKMKKIVDDINYLLKTMRCSRVGIYQFHNGGKSLTGSDFLKFSCTYEDCADKRLMRLDKEQGGYINSIIYWLISMKQNRQFIVKSPLDTVRGSLFTFQYMELNNIKALLCQGIYEGGDLVGFIMLEWDRITSISERMKQDISNIGFTISGALKK